MFLRGEASPVSTRQFLKPALLRQVNARSPSGSQYINWNPVWVPALSYQTISSRSVASNQRRRLPGSCRTFLNSRSRVRGGSFVQSLMVVVTPMKSQFRHRLFHISGDFFRCRLRQHAFRHERRATE